MPGARKSGWIFTPRSLRAEPRKGPGCGIALPLTRKRVEKLAHRRYAMIARRGERRLAQGDGLDIIPATDLGLGAVFHGAQQLRHRANEGVGKPHFLPAWRHPVAGLLFGCEVERTGSACRITRP